MDRGDLLLVSLPISDKREQSGVRPALAIQTSSAANPMLIVAPITSNLNVMRFPLAIKLVPTAENGLADPSAIMLFQLRAIDKNRIIKKIGHLSADEMESVTTEIRRMLEL